MIYVGVDIAKLNHFASAISSDGEVLIEPFKFTNDADGFHMLVSKLISLNAEPDSIIIGLESTAHYGETLLVTCITLFVLISFRFIASSLEELTFAFSYFESYKMLSR